MKAGRACIVFWGVHAVRVSLCSSAINAEERAFCHGCLFLARVGGGNSLQAKEQPTCVVDTTPPPPRNTHPTRELTPAPNRALAAAAAACLMENAENPENPGLFTFPSRASRMEETGEKVIVDKSSATRVSDDDLARRPFSDKKKSGSSSKRASPGPDSPVEAERRSRSRSRSRSSSRGSSSRRRRRRERDGGSRGAAANGSVRKRSRSRSRSSSRGSAGGRCGFLLWRGPATPCVLRRDPESAGRRVKWDEGGHGELLGGVESFVVGGHFAFGGGLSRHSREVFFKHVRTALQL